MRQPNGPGGFEPKRKPGRPKKTSMAPFAAPETAKPVVAAAVVQKPVAKPVATAKATVAAPVIAKPMAAVIAKPAAPKAVVAAKVAPKPVAAAPVAPSPVTPAPVAPAAVVSAPHPVATPVEVAPVPSPEPTVIPEPVIEEKIMATIADTFATTPADATAKMQGFVADAQGRAKSAMEKSTKFYEELGDFTKGNVEALMASSKVAATAAETMGQDLAAYGKQSVEDMTTLFKSFASVKSPTELFQLQSDFARKAFDAAVAEGSKVSEKLVKVTGDIVQPISTRLSLAAEKVKGVASL